MGDKTVCYIAIYTMIMTFVFLSFSTAVASGATIYVEVGNQTIQQVVDNATDGDTIIVRDGTYYENVDINKRLTIRSENGHANCIVNALNSSDYVFEVTSDYVNIEGFRVENATLNETAGIYLFGANYCNISKNDASENRFGVYLSFSNDNTLTNNTADSNNNNGIHLSNSNNNKLTENKANSNGWNGIYLSYSSNNNNITKNTCLNNLGGGGIHLSSASNNNNITDNTASSNNEVGIYLTSFCNDNNITRNTCPNNKYGIRLHTSSDNNTIENNDLSYNNDSIYLSFSSNNLITKNTANFNSWNGFYMRNSSNNNTITENTANSNLEDGIRLKFSCNNNTIAQNTFQDNFRGIRLYYSSNNNTIYDNYLNNLINAADNGNNTWNITGESGTNIVGGSYLGGNYWSDYAGVDNDGDGLGDTLLPHNSSGNITTGGDWLPLTQFSVTPPEIISFSPASSVSNVEGETRIFNITIDQVVNVIWLINGTQVQTNSGVIEANYTNTSASVGIWNVSAVVSNLNGSDIKEWTWTVDLSGDVLSCPFDICANTSGWWRDNGTLNPVSMPIQAAVSNANNGETISVDDGTYNENVDVNKRLTIKSKNGSSLTIVTAAISDDHAFNITSDYVNVSGFTIKDATLDEKAGINLEGANNCNISKNNVSNNYYGIRLLFSNNNIIYNNYFSNTNNANDSGNNIWNTVKQSGTNIIGDSYLGGNYWSDYTGVDNDGDGLGDTLTPYNSSKSITNGGDYLPLTENRPPNQPANIAPVNGASDVSTGATLKVHVTDPNGNSMNVEFYNAANDQLIGTKSGVINNSDTEITWNGLSYNTVYQWYAIVNNSFAENQSDIWSFTTKKAPSNDDDDDGVVGGGGGGGGGIALPTSEIKTDRYGKVLEYFSKTSSDGNARLIIPAGTIVLDADGDPLKSVSISPMPIGGTIAAYNLGPDGATFDPAIDFKIQFNLSDTENNDVVIKVFRYGEWTELETTVDTTTNTATAKIDHFTVFALFTKSKATTMAPTVMPFATETQTPEGTPTVDEGGKAEESEIQMLLIIVAIVAIVVALVLMLYMRQNEK